MYRKGPLDQTQLHPIMQISTGDPSITIGVIDGPIELSHSGFSESKIRTVKDFQFGACKSADSMACIHGTFVTGILCAKRGLAAPAICPSCQIILYPIFTEAYPSNLGNATDKYPSATPEELARAIIETVDAGANIINLSLGLSSSSLAVYSSLQEAYDYALRKQTIIIAATGNQGNIGNISLLNHEWVIPVAACDEFGRLDSISNFGPSIAKRGLMAPGINIRSTYPGGRQQQYAYMSGTSFAAPFVTGAVALLLSIFKKKTTAAMIIHSITNGSFSPANRPRSITPLLLNAKAAYDFLKKRGGQ